MQAEEQGQSVLSWRTIRDERVARWLVQRAELRSLEPFVGRESTVKAAASELGLGLNAAFRKVKQLEALGLLEVSREEIRGGRRMKHYRATADEFRVPLDVLPLETVFRGMDDDTRDLFERNLAALLLEHYAQDQRWAIRVFRNHQDRVALKISPAPGQFWALENLSEPAFVGDWFRLKLDFESAKALQLELLKLRSHYSRLSGPHEYMLGTFMIPVVTER
jgi:hypothetical protein